MDPKPVFFTGIFLRLLMAVPATQELRSYHFINTSKTWSEAQIFCRMNYADLATVDYWVEHKKLLEIIDSADVSAVWIGLERSETKRWVWSEGIGEVKVYEWPVTKPGGDCVEMRSNGLWYTNPCDEKEASLCFEWGVSGEQIYFLNPTRMSWRGAQRYCRQYHSDLVGVETEAENMVVRTWANMTIWIGLIREDWMWSDGSPGSLRYWDESSPEPSGSASDCVAIKKSLQRWDDVSCDLSYPFVCQGGRKMKRTLVRVKIRSGVNLNLPAVSDSLLKQVQEQLEEQGVTHIKIHWQADKNGQIFQLQ